MNVRAKFTCNSVTEVEYDSNMAWRIEMSPVIENQKGVEGQACEENKIFGKWTPVGSLDMIIVNPQAAKQFEIGKCYYLDFKEV